MDEKCDLIWRIGDVNIATSVVGEPFHESPKELIDRAVSSGTSDNFLRYEGTHSIGDYYIVQSIENGFKIITSAGCSGLYFYPDFENGCVYCSRHLGDVLKMLPVLKIQEDALSFYLYDECAEPPFFTLFEGVVRLGSCEVLTVKEQKSTFTYDIKSFLNIEPYFVFDNLFDALCHTVSKIANHYSELPVMFSGGVDSTLIAMALKASGYSPKLYSYWRSATLQNNPIFASTVAEAINLKLEIVEETKYLPSGEVSEFIFQAMKRDFVNPMNPHWGPMPFESKLSLSGQNADAIAVMDMHKAFITKEYSIKTLAAKATNFLYNYYYTDLMLNSKILSQLHFSIFKHLSLHLKREHNVNLLLNGVLFYKNKESVIIPSTFRNLIYKQVYDRESDICKGRNLLEKLHYSYYMLNACKHIQKHFTVGRKKTLLVYQSSPIIKYFLSRQRRMIDAWLPKHEFYTSLEELEISYMTLQKGKQVLSYTRDFGKINQMQPCKIMQEYRNTCTINRSSLLNTIQNVNLADQLKAYIKTNNDIIDNGQLTRALAGNIYRLANLEFIVNTASKSLTTGKSK